MLISPCGFLLLRLGERPGLAHDMGFAGACGSSATYELLVVEVRRFMRPARQSLLACSMRSRDEDTKFHSMKRSPNGSQPGGITIAGVSP